MVASIRSSIGRASPESVTRLKTTHYDADVFHLCISLLHSDNPDTSIISIGVSQNSPLTFANLLLIVVTKVTLMGLTVVFQFPVVCCK